MLEHRLVSQCRQIIEANSQSLLGLSDLPEDSAPSFDNLESKLSYFTLPMSLNYRRNSTQLWEAALATYTDPVTSSLYSLPDVAELSLDVLQTQLIKHRLAMQPTRHTLNWHMIATTVYREWGSFEKMLQAANYDFLKLKESMQKTHKKGFPYLSGPKLFNYWSFILGAKCGIELRNKEYIDIAVDSHIARCSVRLGLISEEERMKLSAEMIAERWRAALHGTEIAPVDLNVPLWFWSRNNFKFEPVE